MFQVSCVFLLQEKCVALFKMDGYVCEKGVTRVKRKGSFVSSLLSSPSCAFWELSSGMQEDRQLPLAHLVGPQPSFLMLLLCKLSRLDVGLLFCAHRRILRFT